MTYQQVLDYLFKQLPMYQREGISAYKKDLKNTEALCAILDHPQKKFKSIHIAGTNGKGSSAHMLASIFQEAGFKTGLYTSPHLKDFRERIRINGEMISKEEVVQFIDEYKTSFESIKPSFFEWTVALAFQIFAKAEVDIAIIETGLGGRLDSTNVIVPELCLITNISLDHTEMLGDTVEAIATEKAGIIKDHIPIVISENSSVRKQFESAAMQRNAPLFYAEELETNLHLQTDLMGDYQSQNIKGVIQCWLILRTLGWKISLMQLERGLLNVVKNTKMRGRWEVIGKQPTIIAETAHNEGGLAIAIKQLLNSTIAKNIHFVVGFVKEKNLDKVLSLFPKEAHYYFCQANIPRAFDVHLLTDKAKQFGLVGKSYSDVTSALKGAKAAAKNDETIYVGGSTFVVAEVL